MQIRTLIHLLMVLSILAGAGEYIKKPYQLEKIGLAVRQALDR